LQWLPIRYLGVYGIGFVLALTASLLMLLPLKKRLVVGLALLAGLAVLSNLPFSPSAPKASVQVAGLQMEFPNESEIIPNLDKLARQHPEAQLLVLSEYTYTGPPPDALKEWCRRRQRYLVVGAEDPAGDANYYNTAFVIGPAGEIVFRQAKSVPIQFFKD